MQAILMAAGLGSRIHEITHGRPKSFLTINEETLINRSIRLLQERGIREIILITGYRADDFHDLLGKNVTYCHNPLYFCTNVIASFAAGMDLLDEDFIYLHADTLFCPAILDELLAAESDDIVLPIDFKSCVEEEMKVTTSNRLVKKISKQIDLASAEGEFIGMAKVARGALEPLRTAVRHELKVARNFDEYFEVALQNLIDKGIPISWLPVKGRPWIEIDFPEDYELAKRMFADE